MPEFGPTRSTPTQSAQPRALEVSEATQTNTTTLRAPSLAPVANTPSAFDPSARSKPRDDSPTLLEPSAPSKPRDDSPNSTLDSALAEETSWIDAARTELQAGNPASALQYLAKHDERPNFVHLVPEALYLRMEAQRTLGNRAAAARAARTLLSRFPHAPQAKRAADVLTSSP